MNVCLHEKLYENIKMIYQKYKKKKCSYFKNVVRRDS